MAHRKKTASILRSMLILTRLLTGSLIVAGVIGLAMGVSPADIRPAVPYNGAALPGQEDRAANISQLAWLAGDWETTGGQPRVEEHWTRPAGGTMIGMGRTLVGDRTVSFEYLRIEWRSDGVYYVAQPQGRPPVDFRLGRLSGSEVVFENPGHSDHLQHIIYRRESEDAIVARIEGANNGKSFAEDFHYSRMMRR